ncbi:MAG: NADH-quinone oxidoreductase subunit L [Magnetococcales bacterium]|nr:NADH-quinone oxidoreductase subunit L [Magnetococcales bacterium]
MYQEVPWTAQADFPILGVLQLLPLAMTVLIALLRRSLPIFPLGLAGAVAELLLALELWNRFDHRQAAFQFAERYPILGSFQYQAAVDGMAVLFILLCAFLTLIVILYNLAAHPSKPPAHSMILIFTVEAALMSQFATVDLMWYALASGVQLILVGGLQWDLVTSSPEKGRALARYLIFMTVSTVLLLAGAVLLGWNHDQAAGGWSFGLAELSRVTIQPQISSLVFFLIFYALAIRIPLFPLHGWLPLTAEHGTLVVAPVFLLGLKTGIYGLLRFVFPLMKDAVVQWHGFVVGIAVAGVFYAAVLALMETNLRRLLAFAVISHTGIMAVGLFSLGHTAFQGGVLLAANFGLAITGLLITSSFVYVRTGTMLLTRLGGLFDTLPVIGTAFLIAGFSTIGMPGTPSFDGVHLVLEAAIGRFGALVTIPTALGNVAAAGFLLRAFQRAFLSPRPAEETEPLRPPALLERFIALSVILVLLITGFHSEPWMELTEKSLEGLGALYGGHP